jgi:hypothetical protein
MWQIIIDQLVGLRSLSTIVLAVLIKLCNGAEDEGDTSDNLEGEELSETQ